MTTPSNDATRPSAVLPPSPSLMDNSPAQLLQLALAGDHRAAFSVYTLASDASNGISADDVEAVRQVFIDRGEPAPEPSPEAMARLEAAEYARTLDALDAAAKTATKREHLAANPELVPRLIHLAKAGAVTAHNELASLVKLDLLEDADLSTFRELAKPAERETGDAPPIPIVHKPQPLPGLPVPSPLVPYINAVVELAGSSVGTAHCAVVGAINLAIADGVDVESLAADIHPASLFLMASARTGWRKSAAFALAFRAHREADDAIHSRWEEARREQKANRSSDGAPLPLTPLDRPKEVSPIALRDDSTIEALMLNLAQGRRTQALASAEAGVLLGGWSFGKAQAGQTLAKLSALWSGETVDYERVTGRVSVRVGGVRLTGCLLAQPSFVAEHLLSEAAANGFAARTLISRDIDRPTPMTFEWPAGSSARFYVSRLND